MEGERKGRGREGRRGERRGKKGRGGGKERRELRERGGRLLFQTFLGPGALPDLFRID